MGDFWTLDDVKADMELSARGADILGDIQTANCSVEICSPFEDSPNYDPRMERSAGYFDPESNRIILNSTLGHDAAIVTLAHEGEHLRQHQNKELPRVGDTKDEYIDKGLLAEARAESAANQVAYELSEQKINGPLEAKLTREYHHQTEAYVEARKSTDHAEAALISEQSWVLNPYAHKYESEFAGRWTRIDNHMQAAFPEQKDPDEISAPSPESDKIRAYRERMQGIGEENKLRPPEPPAETNKPTHGLSM